MPSQLIVAGQLICCRAYKFNLLVQKNMRAVALSISSLTGRKFNSCKSQILYKKNYLGVKFFRHGPIKIPTIGGPH